MEPLPSSHSSPPFLEARQLSKRFAAVRALAGVDLRIERGSCHGLVGENGAGKSTLAKILGGIYRPDEGEVLLDGQRLDVPTPRAALAAGIALVHQELALCENLSVAENLCLGRLPATGPFVSPTRLAEQARAQLAAIETDIDPRRRVGELPISQRQLVQIAAALGSGARLLILDEPTSSLSAVEVEHLFALVRRLQQRAVAIVYVSHRLSEVLHLCDTITVLRDGQVVATESAAACDEPALVQRMIGRPLSGYFPPRAEIAGDETVLQVESLASAGKFVPLSFSVGAGEILGLAGLIGAGRSAVAAAIAGLDARALGNVDVAGRRVGGRTPRAAIDAGIGLVPEDRHRQGMVPALTAAANVTLPILARLAPRWWLSPAVEARVTRPILAALHVGADKDRAPAATLSGGTQQKLLLARWLAARCRVLILDEPTRGIDVGSKAEIYRLIAELAAAGNAILLISSDLPEILHLSSRILVMRRGALVGEVRADEATEEGLMRLMTGS